VINNEHTYVLDHNHFGSSLAILREKPPEGIRPLGTSIFGGHLFRHYLGWRVNPRRAISPEKRVSNVLPSSKKYSLSAAEGGHSSEELRASKKRKEHSKLTHAGCRKRRSYPAIYARRTSWSKIGPGT
jgi:hypothetical protein